jgi:hypothetical protein
MNSIFEIFKCENSENSEKELIKNIGSYNDIFNYIEYVFDNPTISNIANLNILYKTHNSYNINLLKELKNSQNLSIIDFYNLKKNEVGNYDLKIHIDNYIKSYQLSNNMLALLKKPASRILEKQPTIKELLHRIEYLEKTVDELKIRISNEDFFTNRATI